MSPGIERAFKNLDLNSDAKISVEEFLNFWTHNVIEDDCHEDHHASAHRAADSAPRPRMLIRSESIELPMFGYASAL